MMGQAMGVGSTQVWPRQEKQEYTQKVISRQINLINDVFLKADGLPRAILFPRPWLSNLAVFFTFLELYNSPRAIIYI